MESQNTATMADGSPLPPHLERVVAERDQLTDRRTKLVAFFDAPLFGNLPSEEQEDLRLQAEQMLGYGETLNRRLARAGVVG